MKIIIIKTKICLKIIIKGKFTIFQVSLKTTVRSFLLITLAVKKFLKKGI